MKTLKTLKVTVMLILVSLSWTACKKDVVHPAFVQNQSEQNMKSSGALEDDANLISKVPLIMSSEYFASQDYLYRRSVGGIVKGGGKSDGIPPSVSIVSPGNGVTVSGDTMLTLGGMPSL